MIPITRSSMPPLEEYIKEIEPLWENRWLTNSGEKHRELERSLAERLDVQNVTLFTNGHLALEIAIGAMIDQGEVITTPFTFASTTQAIVRNHLTPVFCDIKQSDYTLDPAKIEALITPKTKAIVAVHVYGNVCDTEAIETIAKKHGLYVIYDAAHAFGEYYKGRSVAALGDLSMFSFHATKVFHTIEGGCVTFADARLAPKLDALKNFGQYSPEDVGELGGNAKMNEFQAAMGICNLRHIDEEIAKRKKASDLYRELLKGLDGITINEPSKDVVYNYAYFPILVEKEFGLTRDLLLEKLKEKGILTRKYFYPLTSSFACYDGAFDVQPTPIAEEIASKVLTLPLFADITTEQVEYIVKTLKEIKAVLK